MGGVWALAVLFGLGAPTSVADAAGFLWPDGDGGPVPYTPRTGDRIFYSRRDLPMAVRFSMARTGHPHHTGLVIGTDGGPPLVLEVGTTVVPEQRVALLAIPWRFCEHLSHGRDRVIWVRRIRRPLTPDETERLRAFAWAQ